VVPAVPESRAERAWREELRSVLGGRAATAATFPRFATRRWCSRNRCASSRPPGAWAAARCAT
jgi:hypothetical protein